MHLWNDYEGRTIADIFPLNKLLAPEGRSAFFSTTNGTGTPAVIRLIEAHFDEAEILDRWRQVAEIKQPNLVILKKYGQTVVDGTPLADTFIVTNTYIAGAGRIVRRLDYLPGVLPGGAASGLSVRALAGAHKAGANGWASAHCASGIGRFAAGAGGSA